MNEQKIIKKLKRGDVAALSQIIDIYSPYAYAVINNIIGNKLPPEDTEEALSDCFLCLWENRQKISEESIKAYIASIARSRALDRLRLMKICLPLEENFQITEVPDPEAEVLISELSKLAREAVDSLPEPDCEIFRRHYFMYESCESIAQNMNINASTVRSKLFRGRTKLKAYLSEKGYEYENTLK